MPIINVSEKDFGAAFMGAHAAKDAGDDESAQALDKLARKINAALSQTHGAAKYAGGNGKRLGWQDMPSVFEKPE